MNNKSILTDANRVEHLDKQWYCPNCGKKANVRFEYGTRIIKCEDCGEFIIGIVLDSIGR